MATLNRAVKSTAWNTLSANVKYRVADFLSAGDAPAAAKLVPGVAKREHVTLLCAPGGGAHWRLSAFPVFMLGARLEFARGPGRRGPGGWWPTRSEACETGCARRLGHRARQPLQIFVELRWIPTPEIACGRSSSLAETQVRSTAEQVCGASKNLNDRHLLPRVLQAASKAFHR